MLLKHIHEKWRTFFVNIYNGDFLALDVERKAIENNSYRHW